MWKPGPNTSGESLGRRCCGRSLPHSLKSFAGAYGVISFVKFASGTERIDFIPSLIWSKTEREAIRRGYLC